MEQQRELRNGIVSALEWSVSTADALKPNRTLNIVRSRRDGFQLSHSVHNHIGILQSVSRDGANNPASFRNIFE
jgi:hypothetical protein